MTRVLPRSLAALVLVGGLALAAPLAASAGNGAPTAAQRAYHQALTAYDQAKASIQKTFRNAVRDARQALHVALAAAKTAAQRSAAQQTYETAIINAAAVRSNALIALGSAPTNPSKLHTLTLH